MQVSYRQGTGCFRRTAAGSITRVHRDACATAAERERKRAAARALGRTLPPSAAPAGGGAGQEGAGGGAEGGSEGLYECHKVIGYEVGTGGELAPSPTCLSGAYAWGRCDEGRFLCELWAGQLWRRERQGDREYYRRNALHGVPDWPQACAHVLARSCLALAVFRCRSLSLSPTLCPPLPSPHPPSLSRTRTHTGVEDAARGQPPLG